MHQKDATLSADWALRDEGQADTVRETSAALATDVRHLRRLIPELVDGGYVDSARGIGTYRIV